MDAAPQFLVPLSEAAAVCGLSGVRQSGRDCEPRARAPRVGGIAVFSFVVRVDPDGDDGSLLDAAAAQLPAAIGVSGLES